MRMARLVARPMVPEWERMRIFAENEIGSFEGWARVSHNLCLNSQSPHSHDLKVVPMIRCLTLLMACSLALVATADDEGQTAPPESAEMKKIFNGEDLSGWDGDPRLWSIKDGVIHGETTPDNAAQGNTFLIWKGGEVADFELRLSFRATASNNSGIQYRSALVTEGPRFRNPWVVKGYQHEIRNENTLPNVSGFIYDEGGKRGRVCLVGEQASWDASGKKVADQPLIDADEFKKLMKVDDWNDVVIIAKGNHLQHYLNGRLIMDFTDNHPDLALSSGILALQLHAGKPMWAEFKDIRIRELNSD